MTATHISQLPAQAKTILISCGRLWYGLGESRPQMVAKDGRSGQKNRWRIHATLVIYDLPPYSGPVYSLLLWFAFSLFFPLLSKEGGVYSSRVQMEVEEAVPNR